MSHIPVNHPLRPLYRALAALVGAFVLVFGALGFAASTGEPFFDQGDATALGLPTNLAFSVTSVVAGLAILLAVFVGRNVDHVVNLWGGVAFLVVGLGGLALLRTDLNLLNFSMATVIVSFLIGIVLLAAGLYGRSGSAAAPQSAQLVGHAGH